MNDAARPRFGKGVKLRHDADGTAMLLVPEGALALNAPAAVALELVDGERSVDEIVAAVISRFDVTLERAHADVHELFERLEVRGFLLLRQGSG
ncbi:MAG: pyrroloquinoline quinone biosynthesis peptide chaperone PqqD [Candidatus Eremiobacteraeota bacterium]|nr:pyrroloquinoline quinone biosynthesis peptide chaperone PqqD [Candidatus Eremiobacteraeota bacterium]MBV8498371.1 pyrroloquinoline quinone biosynthesis peptide chaperone PqqD [Candidatus Eremiobacteraeota bacterium]